MSLMEGSDSERMTGNPDTIGLGKSSRPSGSYRVVARIEMSRTASCPASRLGCLVLNEPLVIGVVTPSEMKFGKSGYPPVSSFASVPLHE
jgi:hypothetical protein